MSSCEITGVNSDRLCRTKSYHCPIQNSFNRFLAALMSRSCTEPHSWQVHSRTDNGNDSTLYPQSEQVLLEGNQRSTTNTLSFILYSNCLRNSENEAPLIALDKCLFFSIPVTFKSSMTATLKRLAISVVV